MTAASTSSGYYAMLPLYYVGMYPAIFVSSDASQLNESALAMWGYGGTFITGEFILASSVVSTSKVLEVANVTVPLTFSCPNAACAVISHSGV